MAIRDEIFYSEGGHARVETWVGTKLVRISLDNGFGDFTYEAELEGSGNKGHPTELTFGVSGGNMEILLKDGESISCNSITIKLVGEMEHDGLKEWLLAVADYLQKNDN